MKLGLLTVIACAACTVLPPPDPVVRPDHGGDILDCPAMCATVERLGCAEQWGIEVADGACLDLCQAVERSGTMCPAWVATARDCDEADRLSQCGDAPE